ncbi:MAG: RagB/SusD family nutrient uptake outer membrane protein [Ekhidna sp.]|nr:RagB/SusD family nutrient uptake outer membrane protein [Ekhidna sp.]
MKKYILLIGLFSFFSCEDKLELVPEQSISDELAFGDIATAQGVLIGTYNLLQDAESFGGMIQLIDEYMADNVNFSGSFPDLQAMNNYQQNANNTNVVTNAWRENYEVILGANSIIANADAISDASEDEIDQLKGEAYFLRAISYFQLCNMYAQPFGVSSGSNLAVPLYLEPFSGEVILLERSTLTEVHNQIIDDLNEAIDLLPNEIQQGRASSLAATALLARIRLYRGEWQEAAELANTVITSEVHTIAADYTFYNTVNSELIFTIENTSVDNTANNAQQGNSYDLYYEGVNDGGRGDAEFAADLEAAFLQEMGDKRLMLREMGTNFGGAERFYSTKFNDGTNGTSDAPLIRVSEMYLTRAEALAELNDINQMSIDLMNPIRTRAGLTEWTIDDFSSKDEFITAILTERRKELAFEGHRRLDLLRRALPLRTTTSVPVDVERSSPVGLTAGDNLIIYPIPQREIDLNANLQQNPGF